MGISAAFMPAIIQNIVHRVQPKKILIVAETAMLIASLLLPFADTRDRYWDLLFIAFIIGSCGAMSVYITSR
jgi:nitrate/nitrite transporter NarK